MRASRWPKRFLKCCPRCQAMVQDGAAGVVRCWGRLYCCQVHAERDEARLYHALQAFHRRHAARHGGNRLLTAASFRMWGRIIAASAGEPSRRARRTRSDLHVMLAGRCHGTAL